MPEEVPPRVAPRPGACTRCWQPIEPENNRRATWPRAIRRAIARNGSRSQQRPSRRRHRRRRSRHRRSSPAAAPPKRGAEQSRFASWRVHGMTAGPETIEGPAAEAGPLRHRLETETSRWGWFVRSWQASSGRACIRRERLPLESGPLGLAPGGWGAEISRALLRDRAERQRC